jgi:hypothetical protein
MTTASFGIRPQEESIAHGSNLSWLLSPYHFFVLVVMEFELRALCLLGRLSTTLVSALFAFVICEIVLH